MLLSKETRNLLINLCEVDRRYKTGIELHMKLSEETGELAKELMIANGTFGYIDKEPGKDGVTGETADVIIAALATYFVHYDCSEFRWNELVNAIAIKLQKWEVNQEKEILYCTGELYDA